MRKQRKSQQNGYFFVMELQQVTAILMHIRKESSLSMHVPVIEEYNDSNEVEATTYELCKTIRKIQSSACFL